MKQLIAMAALIAAPVLFAQEKATVQSTKLENAASLKKSNMSERKANDNQAKLAEQKAEEKRLADKKVANKKRIEATNDATSKKVEGTQVLKRSDVNK